MAVARPLSGEALEYIRARSRREDACLSELRAETRGIPALDCMVSDPEEGQFLALLIATMQARTVLEIGTFTGYGTLWMARAVTDGGRVVTIDLTDRWPSVGRPYWDRAGVADRVDARTGDAAEVCSELLRSSEWGPGSFDFVFIDANKDGYPSYLELTARLVRHGGLIAIDNTLLFGRVLDPSDQDPDTVGVRKVNATVGKDERFDLSFLPVADGLTLLRRR